jgi:hypothetical protein
MAIFFFFFFLLGECGHPSDFVFWRNFAIFLLKEKEVPKEHSQENF